ncbi:MAG: carbohydrate ABC transporter substrate-binding protein [Bacilli bacterium]|nr:carbohydrate ABC transporter substrate-binding protein [Bacilli bacterium]
MKRLLMLSMSMFMTMSFTSCGNNNGERAFKPRLDTNIEMELEVRGHYSNFEALDFAVARFQKYYPNVEINYVCDPSHKKNLITTLSGDTPPDIFFTYSSLDFSLYDEYTEDLATEDLDINLDCIKDAYIYRDANGKVPYVPIFTATYGMMVNEDLFKNNNIKIPETYNELITACDKFQEMDGIYPMLAHNSMIVYPIFFPHFCASILGDQEKVDKLNSKDKSAGEYMRPSLTMLNEFMSHDYVDLEACAAIKDDYDATIKRFFEGDVAMMLAKGNTFSGTEKREPKDEHGNKLPLFKYSFAPVPTTDEGGYMYNTVELCFSVNKKSTKLDMANEFMRFIVSTTELNKMNNDKRMTSPCKKMSLDGLFAGFGKLKQERCFTPSQIGLSDWADKQVRKAGDSIIALENPLTIDEAIAKFGEFPD